MGIPHQIPLDLPADLALKMASGQYVITDVVVRSVTSGRYAHFLLTCTLLVTCAVEHVGYVVGGHGLGLELSAGQSDGDVLQGA